MRFVLRLLGFLALAAILLPPIWYMAFPPPFPPDLPPPGTRTFVATHNQLNVVKQGAGRPVLLVHGLPGTAYDWRDTSAELAELGRRAIAYDRVGYGYSDPRTNGRYTPQGNAADLLALIQALVIHEGTVVGWSYGGATAMLAALEQPDRIKRLVLVGTAGPDSADAKPPPPSLLIRALYSTPMLHYRRSVPPLSLGLMKVLSNAAFSGGPQPGWWLEGLQANFARWDTLITYREELLNLNAEGLERFDPREIQVPTLLLHGDDDRLAPIATARYLASTIPNAKLVVYPGASHMLPVTHAAEIARQIAEFSADLPEPRLRPGRF